MLIKYNTEVEVANRGRSYVMTTIFYAYRELKKQEWITKFRTIMAESRRKHSSSYEEWKKERR